MFLDHETSEGQLSTDTSPTEILLFNKNRERIIKLLNIFWSLQRGGWGRDAGGEKKRGERH